MDVRNKCQRKGKRERGAASEIKRLRKLASQGGPLSFLAPSARKTRMDSGPQEWRTSRWALSSGLRAVWTQVIGAQWAVREEQDQENLSESGVLD